MDDAARSTLRLVGIQAALLAAAAHLYWGVPDFLTYARAGIMPDVRPPLFLLSGLLVFALVGDSLRRTERARLHEVAVVAILAGWALGYAAWHLGGHGGFVPGQAGYGHAPANPVGEVVGHLLDDPLALFAMLAELVGVGALGALLVADGGSASGSAAPDGDADADATDDREHRSDTA